jgi:pimeloyl-ACP methyl ester carboxylesterase
MATDTATLPSEREIFSLSDGRNLSYAFHGADAGPAIVVLDCPGSRGMALAGATMASELGVRLLAIDRPGFGDSSPGGPRGIADWPADCLELLDELGIHRVGIWTQSGGTPYGLALAASAPNRVIAISLLGAIAPTEEPESVKELGREVRVGVRLSRRAPWLLKLMLRSMARRAQKDPHGMARRMAEDLPAADAATIEDPRLSAIHVTATAEILGRPDAIAREIGLLGRPWGFDPCSVTVPARFWSGEADIVHPTSQSNRLAGCLHGARVETVPEAANFGLVSIYPEAMRFAVQS